tara:strand:- start:2088 stop:3089 length:1002 start_codon:yes stop_codon:yes gene_type:complete
MFALLDKKDFNKVIFWSTEIYHSGFTRELSEFSWELYYNFYALYSNAPLYKLKCKFLHFNKTNDFTYLLQFLHILFQSDPDCDIFIVNYMVKVKNVSKITKFEKVFETIEFLLKKNKIYHIINYLKAILTQNESEAILQYNNFMEKKNIPLFKKNIFSRNIFSQVINHFFKHMFKMKKKRIKITKLNNKYIEYYKELNTETISTNMLQTKRHYEIEDYTGIFQLDRDSTSITNVFHYHWEYYSKNTPYWSDKFDEFNASFKDADIIFPNDDLLDGFYEKYNYDVDELPLDISNKSIKKLSNDRTILDFLYKYFKTINLPFNKNKIDIKSIFKI